AVVTAEYIATLRAADTTYRDAIAEADRLDPGWRLEEIVEKRQKDVVPEMEDASAIVLSVLNQLPDDWQSTDPNVRDEHGPYRGIDLFEAVGTLAPNVKLSRELAAGLDDEMGELVPALGEARLLTELYRGRLPIKFADDFISTRLSDIQNSRKVVR